MRKSHFIMAPEVYHGKPVLNMSFEKDYSPMIKVKTSKSVTLNQSRKFCNWSDQGKDFDLMLGNIGDIANKIYPFETHYPFWKTIKNTVFSKG